MNQALSNLFPVFRPINFDPSALRRPRYLSGCENRKSLTAVSLRLFKERDRERARMKMSTLNNTELQRFISALRARVNVAQRVRGYWEKFSFEEIELPVDSLPKFPCGAGKLDRMMYYSKNIYDGQPLYRGFD